MNNVFNPKRFGRLLIKHTIEHYKSYLMSLGVLIGVLSLGIGFFTYINNDEPMNMPMQTGVFAIVLLLGGTMFTSTIFADIGDNKKSVSALTLPASHFEKYLVGWLYSYVLFQLVFLAVYPAILTVILNTRQWPARFEIFDVFHHPVLPWILMCYATLHAGAMCGAIFFKKLHFIKTAFVFFIGLMILSLINKSLIEAALGRDIISAVPFAFINFSEGHNNYSISPPANTDSFFYCLTISLALILWSAAYFRLTEKQV